MVPSRWGTDGSALDDPARQFERGPRVLAARGTASDDGPAFTVTDGNYVWRPKGNRHIARSPNGALVLSMFLRPNIFLAGDAAGRDLR